MSALGQKATWRFHPAMSALPPKADIRRLGCDVCEVPIADITAYSITSSARSRKSRLTKADKLGDVG